jgi:type VI secretion system protein ImpK
MSDRSLARSAGDYVTLVQLIPEASPDQLPDSDSLRNQLMGLLERIGSGGGIEPGELDEARFALAVWADEVVLRSEWPGREQWAADTLQTRLYRTTRGGNEFFEHLAQLRPEQNDAREVYFLVLALGFEGQYAGQPDQIRAIVSHQYETLRGAGRLLDSSQESPVTPTAYELDIELPRVGGIGVVGYLALTILGLASVYGILWLVLYFVGGEVPLRSGV